MFLCQVGRKTEKILTGPVILIISQISKNLIDIFFGIFEGRNPVVTINLGGAGIVSGQGQFLVALKGF